MKKKDVEIAISRQFKKDIPTLSFSKGQKFSSADSTSHCTLSIQEEYYGEGEYTFQGQVGMWNETKTIAMNYYVSGNVLVSKDGDSPVVTFKGTITCKDKP